MDVVATFHMIHAKRCRLLTGLLLWFCGWSLAAQDEPPSILVLNSYHQHYPWTQNIVRGIRDTFADSRLDYVLYLEYMDAKRHPNEAHLDLLADYYRKKYADNRIDVILCSDDHAYQFLLNRHQRLFPDTPVVFCGLNRLEDSYRAPREVFTGLVEVFDVKPTLDLALRLRPQASKVFVICDRTVTGQANRRKVEAVVDEYTGVLDFIFLDSRELSLEELVRRLARLPRDSFALYLDFFQDRLDHYHAYEEILPNLVRICPVPMFCLVDLYPDYGALGGKLNSAYYQGAGAAQMALRLLQGIPVTKIPISKGSKNPYIFNYEQLERFGLDPDRLPADAVFINRPNSLFDRYRNLIYTATVFLLVQTLIIVVLLLNIRRRKQSEAALRKSDARFRELFDEAPVGYHELDMDGRILRVNHTESRMLGYSEAELVGHHIWEFVVGSEISHIVYDKLAGRRLDNGPFERVFRCKDGSNIPVLVEDRYLRDANKKIIGVRSTVQDISVRKEAEQALLESEHRYRLVSETAREIIVIHDGQGNIRYANLATARISGYTVDELCSMRLEQIVAPEYHSHLKRLPQRHMENDPHEFLYQFEIIARDGRRLLLEVSMVPFAPGDEASSVLVVARDVTEHRRAERALRESEQRLNLAMSGANLGLWDMNVETGRVLFDERWSRLLGYAPEQLLEIQQNWERMVHREDLPHVLDAIRAHLNDHSSAIETEARIRAGDGSWRWILMRGKSVEHDAPDPSRRIIGTYLDITQRRLAEEALRKSEERFRLFMNSSDELVFLKDENFQYIMANESYARFLKRPVEAILGTTDFELFPAEWAARYRDTDEAALKAGRTLRSEESCGERIFESRKFPVRLANGRLGVGGFIKEITEQKRIEHERQRLEDKMRQIQKLESLGVLAGGIAHDFNNLLMGILGNADLAAMELQTEHPIQRYLNDIGTAAHRAADLCRQMLAYSGRGRFAVRAVDLNEVIEETARMLRISISKKATLDFDLTPDLPAVQADTAQIRQVVMNLVINASEALEDHVGTISVTTGTLDCDRTFLKATYLDDDLSGGTFVFVRVTDTGCGMDEATRAKICEPFFSTKFTGRGLGMAAVLGVVRGHNGAIEIKSQPGRGSCITVLFPASTTPAEKDNALQALSGCEQPRRDLTGTILVVDDEPSVRSVASQMLEHMGFEVLTADNGLEAIEIFRERAEHITCVLMDLTMPGMDGSATFHELKRINSEVRVILSSGYDQTDVNRRFSDLGVAGFIQKPYKMKKLLDSVDQAMHG